MILLNTIRFHFMQNLYYLNQTSECSPAGHGVGQSEPRSGLRNVRGELQVDVVA